VQVMCRILERYQQGLQLFIRFHLNQRFTQEVMGIQSGENPNFENFRTPRFLTWES
jgi:hypothetical protein